MPASFPAAIKSFVRLIAGVTTMQSTQVNQAYDEIEAIEGALRGTVPADVSISGSLAAGGSAGVAEIGEDGTLRLAGDAMAWDDILPYAVNPGTGLTALGSETYKTTPFRWYFWSDNNAADETYQAFWQIPHRISEGSALSLHLHYVPSANGSGGNNTVILRVQVLAANINSAYGSVSQTDYTLTVGAADADKHLLLELDDLSGMQLSGDVCVAVTRLSKTSGSDNYTGKIYLRFIDWHGQIDKLGSDTEYTTSALLTDDNGAPLTDDLGRLLREG
jgi:hypothetical protein